MAALEFDIEYGQNNGVMVIRPSRIGRLKSLVRLTKKGLERVWVFKDVRTWVDDQGDERIDHRTRGVVCGSHDEGRAFLALCRGHLLLRVNSNAGFFVPFSNALGSYVKSPKGDQPVADWVESELKLMRWDLPSRKQLEDLLQPPAAPKPKGP